MAIKIRMIAIEEIISISVKLAQSERLLRSREDILGVELRRIILISAITPKTVGRFKGGV